MNEGQAIASASEMLRIGRELRVELELAAHREGGIDATALGRRIIREWLEAAPPLAQGPLRRLPLLRDVRQG